ncbi:MULTISPECIES: hypothetical protein [Tenebrionibacter/Tenebrionicola group]|jgi:hypothetical protein|uniref:Uncharacterized protein n=2 Tax=Tenebrionibacter/Tenebrionicola group TaxID=2969848 RepID=A0A8K0V692_9ENTR|nr:MULTISPECIES: hypothetical protein [Tenebrionibacter/Tenebrionicola group]MBK4716556.1 hypothetical protein [Tenebrionibacter intestinalis]MBV4414549.1 hypothetical protein [Tenebrionicola larvae]MBV5097164.1 hypothetical protein [Tenebrionicola larvae]
MGFYLITDDSYFSMGLSELYREQGKTITNIVPCVDAVRVISDSMGPNDVVFLAVDNNAKAVPIILELRSCRARVVQVFEHVNKKLRHFGVGYLVKGSEPPDFLHWERRGKPRRIFIPARSVHFLCGMLDGTEIADLASEHHVQPRAVYGNIHYVMRKFGLKPGGAWSLLLLYRLVLLSETGTLLTDYRLRAA